MESILNLIKAGYEQPSKTPMGYDLHITRKRCWADESGPTITPGEWESLLRSYPKTRFNEFEVNAAGNIVVKNPNKEIRVEMYQIAQKLDAKVQGDEEEIYDAKGDVVRSSIRRSRKHPWVLVLVLILAASVFAVLGLIVFK